MHDNVDAAPRTLHDSFQTVAMFSSTMAVVFAAVYAIGRLGFDNPPLPIMGTLGISLFLLNSRELWRLVTRLLRRTEDARCVQVNALAILTGLVLLALSGLVVPILGFSLLIMFVILGYAAAFLTFRAWIRFGLPPRNIAFLLFAVVFSIWVASVSWSAPGMENPLYQENIALRIAHKDTLFHITQANMLMTYGIPSTGLDGLPYIVNHFGSHWLFDQLSRLLQIRPIQFYSLAYPTLFAPLLYYTLLCCVIALMYRLNWMPPYWRMRQAILFWFIFVVASVGFIPSAAQGALILTRYYLLSESYNLSLTLTFLTILVVVGIYPIHPGQFRQAPRVVLYAVVLPVLLGLMAWFKPSNPILLLALAGYLYLRLGLWKMSRLYTLSLVLSGIALSISYYINALRTPSYTRIDLGSSFAPLAIEWRGYWPLLYFAAIWLFVALRLREQGTRTVGDLGQALKSKRLIDVEALLCMGLVGFAPAFILYIPDGSAFYFADIPRWLGLILLLAYLPAMGSRLNFPARLRLSPFSQIKLAHIALGSLTVLLAYTVLAVAMTSVSNLIWLNLSTRISLMYYHTMEQPEAQMLKRLQSLADLPPAEKKRTALFIPQSNRVYWDLLKNCAAVPFVAPAFSGLAMIDGLPAADCLAENYGYASYKPRTAESTIAANDQVRLCSAAQAKGFDYVIRLDTTSANDVVESRMTCH
jgi:hypothetical protein